VFAGPTSEVKKGLPFQHLPEEVLDLVLGSALGAVGDAVLDRFGVEVSLACGA